MMNFVGHIYLSGGNERVAVGNFIGDYVKGRRYEHFPDDIQRGIIIHRDIDDTMDAHPAFLSTRELFRPVYRRYAGVVVDMAFDHILTKNWADWHNVPLKQYTRQFYATLIRHYRYLPSNVRQFLPFMIQSNRLYSYSSTSGLQKALEIMSNYTSLPNHHSKAIATIHKHEKEIAQNFYELLGDLSEYLYKKYDLAINEQAAIQISKRRTSGE